MRYSEINEASKSGIDLQARYQHYNKLLFGGQLPDIPVTFAAMKGKGGKATCKLEVDPTVPPKTKEEIKRRRLGRYYGVRPKPGTLQIKLANTFVREDRELDGLLIHEMIHIYFFHINRLDVAHDAPFMKMRRELSQKLGWEVPRKDDTDDSEVAATKPVLVFIRYQDRKPRSFAVLAQSILKDVKAFRLVAVKQLLYSGTTGIELVVMNTPAWTKIAHSVPAQRGLKKMFLFQDPQAVEELKKPTQVIFDIHAKEGT